MRSTETWRDIVGIEQYGEVSNKGNVRSKDRFVNNNGTLVLLKGRDKKGTNNGLGYLQYRFIVNGKSYRKYGHVMVAESFLDKPDVVDTSCLEVNHKDYNKSNNDLDNLEWVTHADNIKHAIVSTRLIRDELTGMFKRLS